MMRGRFRPDLATVAGFLLAFGGILGGLILEGGRLQDVAQITAALIVCGGTLGAVLVTTPLGTVLSAVRKLPSIFLSPLQAAAASIEEIAELATVARRSGIVSLEDSANQVLDPFTKKALGLAIDGADVETIREIMELEMEQEEIWLESEAKVYEAAAGYAPTVGIIGAVLGLIQVMKHLENMEEVGRGIAVAFVATIYGVAIANLFLLPAAYKLKARAGQRMQQHELTLQGVLAIAEGLNPKLIRLKLEPYIPRQVSVGQTTRAPLRVRKGGLANAAQAQTG